MNEKILKGKKVAELREIARTFGIEEYDHMKKAELVEALMNTENEGAEIVESPAEKQETAAVGETAEQSEAQTDRDARGGRVVKPH